MAASPGGAGLTDAALRLTAALEGRYRIERELGQATVTNDVGRRTAGMLSPIV
jgi:hypothetical protein